MDKNATCKANFYENFKFRIDLANHRAEMEQKHAETMKQILDDHSIMEEEKDIKLRELDKLWKDTEQLTGDEIDVVYVPDIKYL